LGPGLGAVTHTYAGLPDLSKIALISGMVLGRLEIFTVLVLLTSLYWRK
jgi:trk system potassium uptake protein TrkH